MNCFTHALPFLDRPVFMVGCCVPDWLSSADRKCRAREKLAAKFVDDSDPFVAEVASGIMQHHHDDVWFHQTKAFGYWSVHFTRELADIFVGEEGFRPSLIGHVVIELLLDAYLTTEYPGKLDRYYEQVGSVDASQLQDAISQIATRPTEDLQPYVDKYLQSRFLFDYLDDDRLAFRLNGIMKRVKLPPLDDRIVEWLPTVRERVYANAASLLDQYPITIE